MGPLQTQHINFSSDNDDNCVFRLKKYTKCSQDGLRSETQPADGNCVDRVNGCCHLVV